MRIIKPHAEIISKFTYKDVLEHIELCGRVCYQSDDKIAEGSAEKFISNIIKRGHESVLEHYSITVRFVVDRGVTHEVVRHRVASYSQESTRYCAYNKGKFGGEITVIEPMEFKEGSEKFIHWMNAIHAAETSYMALLECGCTAQEARGVLPNDLKAELMMTANLREWRHFFRMRCDPAAHPHMRQVAVPLLHEFQKRLPVFFADVPDGEREAS